MTKYQAPFPWFGGKRMVANIVWKRFGNVPNYVEPFFGGGAVLLGRPHKPRTETVNDLNALLANFWRASKYDPDGVAEAADRPPNEADLHAVHLWLMRRKSFVDSMMSDPDYYDSLIAGRWVWGQRLWLGDAWCKPVPNGEDRVYRQRIALNAAAGVPSKLDVRAYMRELAERLRDVRVCCGDWSRVCTIVPTTSQGVTGVFLDPPYAAEAGRKKGLYATDSETVAHDVRKWAVEQGEDRRMRIALCGYEGEHKMPASWEKVVWHASGGFAAVGSSRFKDNNKKERIWFSPHCRRVTLI